MKSAVVGSLVWGESKEDVVDMLLELREINPEAIPINFFAAN